MSTFLQLAQSLAVALKALQMYTANHPRAQESLAGAHGKLEAMLYGQERIQLVVTGQKAFVDGMVQDPKNPHIAILVKLVSERGIGGFLFERGTSPEELLVFLHGLALKPAKLQELGGFEELLKTHDVRHIRVSQTRYQEVTEGEESGSGDKAPAFSPAPPSPPAPTPENLVKSLREALLKLMGNGSQNGGDGFPRESKSQGIIEFLDDDFRPSELGGIGALGQELGLTDGRPSQEQMGVLSQVLMGLPPQAQLDLLAGLSSLPAHPAGLALGVKALAGELLAAATSASLAKGATWSQLKGPIQNILRPLADRQALVKTLVAQLRQEGKDTTQAEALLRNLDWNALSLEAKLLKILEEGHLFELSLEQRLAFLRELLDLRRFDEFLRVQDVLLEILQDERPELRSEAAHTLAGMARWAEDPGLPSGGEGAMASALRAHFAWEQDPAIHRWTTNALESLFSALVSRGELHHVMADFQELEGLCGFLEDQLPWRNQAIKKLHDSLTTATLMDEALAQVFDTDRNRVITEVYPYLEFLGNPMASHLVLRLGGETDRAHRGRLVEAVRSLGQAAVPALIEALSAPAWYLVRNTLTLLSDLGDAGCIPAIVPLLRHPEPRVRRTAVRALWKLGGPAAEPHLLTQMKDTDGETMQEILFALGQLRSESSLAQVSALAQDKRVVEQIRIQALDTLGHIASPKAMPVLLECLRRKGFFTGGEAPPIRLAAARALLALGTPETIGALQKAVDQEPKGEEREAFRRLLEPPAPL